MLKHNYIPIYKDIRLSIKVYLYINKDLYYHVYKQSDIVIFFYISNYTMFYINIYLLL